MIHATVSELRNSISDLINQVGFKGERVVLTRNRKDVAAMVPIEDLRMIEAIEDKLDVILAKEALAEHGDEDFIPWEQIKSRYGLK